jgi:hypothetical protein
MNRQDSEDITRMLKFDGASILAFKFVQFNVGTLRLRLMESAHNLLFPFT